MTTPRPCHHSHRVPREFSTSNSFFVDAGLSRVVLLRCCVRLGRVRPAIRQNHPSSAVRHKVLRRLDIGTPLNWILEQINWILALLSMHHTERRSSRFPIHCLVDTKFKYGNVKAQLFGFSAQNFKIISAIFVLCLSVNPLPFDL